jgi:hypothetical protein
MGIEDFGKAGQWKTTMVVVGIPATNTRASFQPITMSPVAVWSIL